MAVKIGSRLPKSKPRFFAGKLICRNLHINNASYFLIALTDYDLCIQRERGKENNHEIGHRQTLDYFEWTQDQHIAGKRILAVLARNRRSEENQTVGAAAADR